MCVRAPGGGEGGTRRVWRDFGNPEMGGMEGRLLGGGRRSVCKGERKGQAVKKIWEQKVGGFGEPGGVAQVPDW